MSDIEFLQWFAKVGHSWRGWPRFHWDTCDWYLSVSDLGGYRIERPYGGSKSTKVFHHSITPPEAACLVRDFLMFHPDLRSLEPRVNREEVNSQLVRQVEAQMEREKDP